MSAMNAQYSDAMVKYGFSQGEIGLFNTEFNYNSTLVRDIIIQTDAAEKQKSKEQLDESNTKLAQYISKMKAGIVTEKEKGYYSTAKNSLDKYSTSRSQVVDLAINNRTTEAFQTMTEQCTPLSDKIRASVESLVKEKTESGNSIAAGLNAKAVASNLIIIFVIILSVLVSILIAVWISRGISKPVSELAKAAKKMANGDLNVQVHVNSKDEIGQLGAAFTETISSIYTYINDISKNLAKMEQGDLTITTDLEYKGDFVHLKKSISGIVISLNDLISEIQQSANHVLSGSEQVSGGSQLLAQGAAEQASSVEELSATVSEISGQVEETASHAAVASENVNHVSAEIETCNEHMQQMVRAMSQISDSSGQIGKIIKTIEDIAFQTNILALNAAVEAARAGAAGKGFAVVADEVRNLASKSAAAAKDTTVLIENTVYQVDNGTKIMNETASSLLRVVDSAKGVSETVQKISESAAKQSNAIVQVNLGMEQISNVVQTNSATAEESAAASEELSGQAKMLKSLVQQFKLRHAAISDKEEGPQIDLEVPLEDTAKY